MEPNIYQMEKWVEEQELRLLDECSRPASRNRSSTKRPALGPVLTLLGMKQPEKACGMMEKGR